MPNSATQPQHSTIAAVGGIAAIAGWVSYVHAYTVIVRYGVPAGSPEAYLYPALVDGPMYVASKVLFEDARTPNTRRAERKERRLRLSLAYGMLAAGISFSVFANALAGLPHGPVGAILNAWPAVAVAVAFKLLMCLIRAGATVPEPASVPAAVPSPARTPGTPSRVRDDAAGYLKQAETVFAAHITGGTLPTFKEVRRALHAGDEVGRQVREHIKALHARPAAQAA